MSDHPPSVSPALKENWGQGKEKETGLPNIEVAGRVMSGSCDTPCRRLGQVRAHWTELPKEYKGMVPRAGKPW